MRPLPPASSWIACGTTGTRAVSPSRTPDGDPGRLTTSESPLRRPCRERSAAIGVWRRPSARISSARPGASRSITEQWPPGSRREARTPCPRWSRRARVRRRAAGACARSRPARPAPRACADLEPASRSIVSATSPDSSTRVPWVTPSDTVTTAARIGKCHPHPRISRPTLTPPPPAWHDPIDRGYAGASMSDVPGIPPLPVRVP